MRKGKSAAVATPDTNPAATPAEGGAPTHGETGANKTKTAVQALPAPRLPRAELERAIISAIPIIRREGMHPTQGSIARALDQDAFRVRQALRRLRRAKKVLFTLKEIVPNRQIRVYFLPSNGNKKKAPTDGQ